MQDTSFFALTLLFALTSLYPLNIYIPALFCPISQPLRDALRYRDFPSFNAVKFTSRRAEVTPFSASSVNNQVRNLDLQILITCIITLSSSEDYLWM